jgi:hypothetical protein
MKAITIDSLNICIFSFVSFSSMAVMLIPRGTRYIKGEVKAMKQDHSQSPSLLAMGCSSFDYLILIDNSSSAKDILFRH